MRHNQIIYLIKTTVTEDAVGNQLEIPEERQVYANEHYLSFKEANEAAVSSLRPEKRFEIYSYEYEGESKLRHSGGVCNIIHAESRGDKMRLTCERVLANG